MTLKYLFYAFATLFLAKSVNSTLDSQRVIEYSNPDKTKSLRYNSENQNVSIKTAKPRRVSRLFVGALNTSSTTDRSTTIKASEILSSKVMVPLLIALMCISIMIVLIVASQA